MPWLPNYARVRFGIASLLGCLSAAAALGACADATYPTHVPVRLESRGGNTSDAYSRSVSISARGRLRTTLAQRGGELRTVVDRTLTAGELRALRQRLARLDPALIDRDGAGCPGRAPTGDVGGDWLKIGRHAGLCPPREAQPLVRLLRRYLPPLPRRRAGPRSP